MWTLGLNGTWGSSVVIGQKRQAMPYPRSDKSHVTMPQSPPGSSSQILGPFLIDNFSHPIKDRSSGPLCCVNPLLVPCSRFGLVSQESPGDKTVEGDEPSFRPGVSCSYLGRSSAIATIQFTRRLQKLQSAS